MFEKVFDTQNKKNLLVGGFSFLVIFMTAIPCCVFSQDRLLNHFQTVTIDDGLPQGYISAILKDSHGFVWIGTKDGLCRYDGVRFITHRNRRDDSYSISHNHITSLLEDKAGNIWSTTAENGVNCWIRTTEKFIRFDTSNGLSASEPLWLRMDKDGLIWVLTAEGLDCIVYEGDSLHVQNILKAGSDEMHYLLGSSDGTGFMPLITNDADNALVFYSEIGISSMSNHDGKTKFVESGFRPDIVNECQNQGVRRFASTGRKGEFILVDHCNVYVCDMNGLSVRKTPTTLKGGVFLTANSLDGKTWASDSYHLISLDTRSNEVLNYDLSELVKSFGALTITCIYSDNEGLLWIGTAGYGLVVYDPGIERFNHIAGYPDKTVSAYVLHECPDGNVFVRSYEAAQVFDPKSKTFLGNFADIYGFNKDRSKFEDMQDLAFGSDGTIWISKSGEIISYDDKGKSEHWEGAIPYHSPELFPLRITGDSMLWTSSNADLICINLHKKISRLYPFPSALRISSNSFFVQQILPDDEGNLWIATLDGLLKFQINKGEWTTYQTSGSNSQLNMNSISVICPDPTDKSILWLGSWGGGVCRFDKRNGDCRVITTNEGLPDDVIYGILADDNARLWVSTNHGLCCYDPQKKSFTNFTSDDGLQSDEFNRYAFLKHSGGSLIFGGVNGLNVFKPDEVIAARKHQLRITDLKLFNHPVFFGEGSVSSAPVYLTDRVHLRNDQNVLTFVFSPMDFGGRKHYYRYMIEGIDKAWIESSIPEVTYSNLPAGDFKFMAQVLQQDNSWSDETAVFSVHVDAPPHSTNVWKLATLSLAAVMLLLTFVMIRKCRRHSSMVTGSIA